jgi:phospholipid/cholesterol/gamma-HCH transport system permease protein
MRGSPWQRVPTRVGLSFRLFLGHLGSLAWLAWQCLRQTMLLRPAQLGVLLQIVRNQVRFTALEALPVVTFSALLVGGITLLQVLGQLSMFGAESYLSQLMALLVVRELGPLLVAVLVVGRSGTAIAAEMATMRLNREVDTLYAIGVDPIAYLLTPRIVGGMISMLVLLVLFDALALLGGYVVASFQITLSFLSYLNALGVAIGPIELVGTFLKAMAFGAVIPLISAHAGLGLHGSSTEIPQAVTRAAVESMVAIFLLGALVSVVCYG